MKRPASNCIIKRNAQGNEAYGGGSIVKDTPARRQARKLREKAHTLSREAHTLAGIDGAENLAEEKSSKANELRDQARNLADLARLEDISVRQVDYWKETKKGRIIQGGMPPGKLVIRFITSI